MRKPLFRILSTRILVHIAKPLFINAVPGLPALSTVSGGVRKTFLDHVRSGDSISAQQKPQQQSVPSKDRWMGFLGDGVRNK